MSTIYTNYNNQLMLEVKSKYDAEFRRFGLIRQKSLKFDEFYSRLENLHGLNGIQFNICYTDKDGDLLPINNDNNLARVLNFTMGILRLIIQRKGECYNNQNQINSNNQQNDLSVNNQHCQNGIFEKNINLNTSYRTASNLINQIKNLKELSNTLTSSSTHNSYSINKPFSISYPEDFRPVSAIIDVDLLPDTLRRVRLHKHKSSKPLGFYIRDGRSLRVTPHGVEQVPGIFISRLMPGGLAESTGLLSVNDEVIEVNGIEVSGKTLDQVTDMMVANSSNLIITVKPTNQRYNLNRNLSTGNPSTSESSNKISKTNREWKNNDLNINDNLKNKASRENQNYSFNNNITNLGIKSNVPKKHENGYGERNNSVSVSSAISSINSSFSSTFNTKEKSSAISPNNFQNKTGEQTEIIFTNSNNPHLQKMIRSPSKNRQNSENNNFQNERNDYEEEIDDEDDEEIHEPNESSSPDNSDDKILTL